MIVGEAELAGLSAISGGGALPGIGFGPAGREEAVAALEGLRGKGVVGADGGVTAFGVVAVRAVEQYRVAGRHVFVNGLKASVNGDGSLTVLQPAPGGWNLARLGPAGLMVALLKGFPWLCGGGGPAAAGPWRPLTAGQWAARAAGLEGAGLDQAGLDQAWLGQVGSDQAGLGHAGSGVAGSGEAGSGEAERVMVVRDVCVSEGRSEIVAYDSFDGPGAGFAFDVGRGLGRSVPVWRIRARLAGLLGCPGGGQFEGGGLEGEGLVAGRPEGGATGIGGSGGGRQGGGGLGGGGVV